MRDRTIVEIHIRSVDQLDSELCLVTDDGTGPTTRTLQSRHDTIEHAARCLADHHGLQARSATRWVSTRTPEHTPAVA